ncbi:MAG TPA: phosphodiester glycosidase family protein [Acidimicrobiales bacterium]
MRKSVVLVAAVALVAIAGASWQISSSEKPDRSVTKLTASLLSAATTTPVPQPVCYSETKPATPGHAATPIEICRPWRARDIWSGNPPSIYTTTFLPTASPAGVVAYAAWIRTSTTDLALYPGYEGPGPAPGLARGPEQVPPTVNSRLLATFNSGFYSKDGPAGFYVHHTLYYPMVRGLATVVRYTNGTVNIVPWTGAVRPGATVLMARQNLPLLVNGGVATPLSRNNAAWGVTLGLVPDVWRSALGIDKNGDLFYAAAPDQTSATLAALMVQLHAVRAMQLDINPAWPIFVSYNGPHAQGPVLDVANPNQIATRFLTVSQKDFFVVYETLHPGEDQPW